MKIDEITKKLLIILLSVMPLLAISGCGGSDETTPEEAIDDVGDAMEDAAEEAEDAAEDVADEVQDGVN